MKNTLTLLRATDSTIQSIEEFIELQNKFIADSQSDIQKSILRKELAGLEIKLKEKKKQRLNTLETLSSEINFEIGMINNELKLKSGEYVECDGLILENTAGI